MTKFVVLSVNENPEYIFYLPLVVWAWKQFGWEPLIFYTEQTNSLRLAVSYAKGLDKSNAHRLVVDGYGTDTVAQIARLYAACLYGPKDDYLMTSDIDMLPLSDYWKFDPEKISVWGHDLTDYQHMPICYIGMKRTRWVEVMGLNSHLYNEMIKRDLDKIPNAKSADSVKRWVVDQDLITERINGVFFDKEMFHRGTGVNGYPKGRVDRSAWVPAPEEFIDCHMFRTIYESPRNPKYVLTMDLLKKIWPQEDFDWFHNYCFDFRQLLKNG